MEQDINVDFEKVKLFKELALDIFPFESWENWEIQALCRMGLSRFFGLENECEE